MRHKSVIKDYAASILDKTGLFRFLNASLMRNRAFVLMYHRVLSSVDAEPVFVQPGMYVLSETFRRHAAVLKENFHVLPLKDIVDRVVKGSDISRCCAITFDDGWKDNYTYAFPVLKEYNLPATIFLATGFVGTKKLFWPEELTFSLRELGMLRNSFDHGASVPATFIKNGGLDLNKAVQEMKTWCPNERKAVIEDLKTRTHTSLPEPLMMSWQEAKEMQSSGLVHFGAHTVNHEILDQIPPNRAESEILESMQDLERHLGVSPEFFAYPNGDYNSRLKQLLKEQGYKGAVTTQKAWICRNIDLFSIPRIGMHEDISNTSARLLGRLLIKKF